MNKKILIAVIALLVLGGGGAGAFFFLQGGEDEAVAEGAEAEPVEEPLADPIYLALSPAFLVNFDHNGTIRYLQIELQVMARDQDIIDKVESNLPAVRNNVIMLLSAQNYDAVSTVEGKDNLRLEVLGAVNEALQFTDENAVEDVFFTNFVVQ
ncbi:MAG: flagellar basal body-associated FliL family protein [Halioglobus sp.]|nr:flagellar basal body-associated FliL family protein [Halioglobus sp.]